MEILSIDRLLNDYRENLRRKTLGLEKKPCLALVLLEENPAARSYKNSLVKQSQDLNVNIRFFDFLDASEVQVISLIEKLNLDRDINGILILQPIPESLNRKRIIGRINPEKDVDGLLLSNLSKLFIKDSYRNTPTTALAILRYLMSIVDLKGKDILIINRSNVIGKPLSLLLLNEDATVTVAHSKSKAVEKMMEDKDIIISAIGKAGINKPKILREGAILIDVGISRDGNSRLAGDFDLSYIGDKNISYMPAIGGIGRLNSNIILENTYLNYMEENNGK